MPRTRRVGSRETMTHSVTGLLRTLARCGAAGAAARPSRGSSNLITRAKVDAAPQGTARSIVQRLRPRWLRSRNSETSSQPAIEAAVFVDDLAFGELDSLNSIPSQRVEQIELIDATSCLRHHTREVDFLPSRLIRTPIRSLLQCSTAVDRARRERPLEPLRSRTGSSDSPYARFLLKAQTARRILASAQIFRRVIL